MLTFLGLEAAVEALLVAGAVDFGEQFSYLPGQFFGAAEVEPVLAAPVAVG